MISFFGGPRGVQGEQGIQGDPGKPMSYIPGNYYTNTDTNINQESQIFKDGNIIIYSDEACNNEVNKQALLSGSFKINIEKNDYPWILITSKKSNTSFAYTPINIKEDNLQMPDTMGISLNAEVSMQWANEESFKKFSIEKKGENIDDKNHLVLDFKDRTISLTDGRASSSMKIPQKWDSSSHSDENDEAYITRLQVKNLIENQKNEQLYDSGQYYISAIDNKDKETNSPFIKCDGSVLAANATNATDKEKYNACKSFLDFKENYSSNYGSTTSSFYYYHSGDSTAANFTKGHYVIAKAANSQYMAELILTPNNSNFYGLMLHVTNISSKKTGTFVFGEKGAYSSSYNYCYLYDMGLTPQNTKGSIILTDKGIHLLFFFSYNSKTYVGNWSLSDMSSYINNSYSTFYLSSSTTLSVKAGELNSVSTFTPSANASTYLRFLDDSTIFIYGTLSGKTAGWYILRWGTPMGLQYHPCTVDRIDASSSTSTFSWVRLQKNSNDYLYLIRMGNTTKQYNVTVGLTLNVTSTDVSQQLNQNIQNFLNASTGHLSMQYGTAIINGKYENYNLIRSTDNSTTHLLYIPTSDDLVNDINIKHENYNLSSNSNYFSILNYNFSFSTRKLIASVAKPRSQANGYEICLVNLSDGARSVFYTGNSSATVSYNSQTSLSEAYAISFSLGNSQSIPLMNEYENQIANNFNFSYICAPYGNYRYLYYAPLFYTITKTEDLVLPNLCDSSKQLYYYLVYKAIQK